MNKAVADANLLGLTLSNMEGSWCGATAELDDADHDGDKAEDGENEDAADEDADLYSGDADDSYDEDEDEVAPNPHASQVHAPIPTAAATDWVFAFLRDKGPRYDMFPDGARFLRDVIQRLKLLLKPLPAKPDAHELSHDLFFPIPTKRWSAIGRDYEEDQL